LSEPERVGDIIARKTVVDPRRKSLRLELLRNNWPSLVGERMAEHSRPTRLSRSTLIVAADGASWAGELSAVSYELLRNIEKVLGRKAVKKVRVLARAVHGELEPAGDVDRGDAEEEYVEEELGVALGDLDDDEVRNALGRMVRASKSSKHSKQGRR
jgi:hypothetical protein